MKRADSLSLLSAWRIAQEPRNLRAFRAGTLALDESSADAARSHGLAALRAIQHDPLATSFVASLCGHFRLVNTALYPFGADWNLYLCPVCVSIRESRLAVRAALAAVGLKTL